MKKYKVTYDSLFDGEQDVYVSADSKEDAMMRVREDYGDLDYIIQVNEMEL